MFTGYDIEGSSTIKTLGYDEEHLLARVEFHKNGQVTSTWEYAGIKPQVFEEWRTAESAGKFFHARIKGHYTGTKLGDGEVGGW